MIHPNRTYLLQLKQKQGTVSGSLKILKARRQALLQEFLNSVRPFLDSRAQIRVQYYNALHELYRSMGDDGQMTVESIAMISVREGVLTIQEKNILGVKYYDVVLPENIRRRVNERNYDFAASGSHMEEAADLFEETIESLLILASFEMKVKRLGEEILRVSRRARVLEERILPDLSRRIKATGQYIGEREREEYFRLKKFKNSREAGGNRE
ncbi:MAG: V-type ATP synthase subunit D [Desulfobulbaceae bacterium]|nr:V-type ATP synthase subunit D [Desulfobulbaceae bacterium]